MIYFYIITLFHNNLFFVITTISKISCIINDQIFQIGEKYRNDEEGCKICICSININDDCKLFSNCKNLNCEDIKIYNQKCCLELNCRGIFI